MSIERTEFAFSSHKRPRSIIRSPLVESCRSSAEESTSLPANSPNSHTFSVSMHSPNLKAPDQHPPRNPARSLPSIANLLNEEPGYLSHSVSSSVTDTAHLGLRRDSLPFFPHKQHLHGDTSSLRNDQTPVASSSTRHGEASPRGCKRSATPLDEANALFDGDNESATDGDKVDQLMEDGTDLNQASKRELKSSRRAAQNRAAQVSATLEGPSHRMLMVHLLVLSGRELSESAKSNASKCSSKRPKS